MGARESFSAWQDVAKYRAARKMIQGGAWGRLIFGVIAVFAGLLSFQLDIIHVGLVVLGGYLVAGFVVAFARPGVAAWILGGTGLVLLGLWNVLYTFADVILYKDKGQAQTFWAVLGAFQILWGARLLLTKSRYVGIHLPAPSPEAVKRVDELCAGLRRARESDGPQFVELVVMSAEVMQLRGKVGPEGAFLVDTSGTHVYFAQPGDLELRLKKEGPLHKRNRCEMAIRGETMPCAMSHASFERIIAWKEGRPLAPAPPTPPANSPAGAGQV